MRRPDARIEQLQKLMGHADISTTATYLHQTQATSRPLSWHRTPRARCSPQTPNDAAGEPERASRRDRELPTPPAPIRTLEERDVKFGFSFRAVTRRR